MVVPINGPHHGNNVNLLFDNQGHGLIRKEENGLLVKCDRPVDSRRRNTSLRMIRDND